MQVFIEREKKSITISFAGSASALLAQLSLVPEDVLIIKNNTVVTEDEELADDDEIKILSVISGG